MDFKSLAKLRRGDKVAVLSRSFAAPAKWPHVYELGLRRLREVFGLEPVAFPTTAKLGAPAAERARDLAAAFERPEIKAVIASLGGDDQVTYVRHLPREPFAGNPKPFFGYSDNTHFINHLWLLGIPSYYGGHLFTEFALQGPAMDAMTVEYLEHALFGGGTVRIAAGSRFSDIGLDWGDPETLKQQRRYQENEGWYWGGEDPADGITWGGCLESIDEMLRHGVPLPAAEQWSGIVLFLETSEEIPSHDYVFRVLRALGERGLKDVPFEDSQTTHKLADILNGFSRIIDSSPANVLLKDV